MLTAILFFCMLLGVVVQLFYQGKLRWKTLIPSILILPIIFMPIAVLGNGMSEAGITESISLGLLAFQNGFFFNYFLKSSSRLSGKELSDSLDKSWRDEINE